MRLTWTGKALENFMAVTSVLNPQKLTKALSDGALWYEQSTMLILKDVKMVTLAVAFKDGSHTTTQSWNNITT